jgi:hypothetical protein
LLLSSGGPSAGRFSRLALVAITTSLCPAVSAQVADKESAPVILPDTAKIFLDYTLIPHALENSVTAVFNKTADKALQNRVGAAMKLDTFQIEAMSTALTEMNLDSLHPGLERRQEIPPVVQSILSLSEKDVDVWNVSMTLAKEAYPNLDAKKYDREFEQVVESVRELTPPFADPETRIRAMNTVIYRHLGIAYDKEELKQQKLINRYAVGVLQTKHGNCFNLALFYIAVAQRLGYPIYPVSAPQHLFARYVTPGFERQNIDPSGRGNYFPDADYVRRLEIPPQAVKNGTYLRTMSYKELAGFMVADHGGFYYGETLKDDLLAIAILERGLDHSPKTSEYWCVLGRRYKLWGLQESHPDVREIKFIRALVFMKKGERMGLGRTVYQELRERKEQEERQKVLAKTGV